MVKSNTNINDNRELALLDSNKITEDEQVTIKRINIYNTTFELPEEIKVDKDFINYANKDNNCWKMVAYILCKFLFKEKDKE